jgi:hypothetical protein
MPDIPRRSMFVRNLPSLSTGINDNGDKKGNLNSEMSNLGLRIKSKMSIADVRSSNRAKSLNYI